MKRLVYSCSGSKKAVAIRGTPRLYRFYKRCAESLLQSTIIHSHDALVGTNSKEHHNTIYNQSLRTIAKMYSIRVLSMMSSTTAALATPTMLKRQQAPSAKFALHVTNGTVTGPPVQWSKLSRCYRSELAGSWEFRQYHTGLRLSRQRWTYHSRPWPSCLVFG